MANDLIDSSPDIVEEIYISEKSQTDNGRNNININRTSHSIKGFTCMNTSSNVTTNSGPMDKEVEILSETVIYNDSGRTSIYTSPSQSTSTTGKRSVNSEDYLSYSRDRSIPSTSKRSSFNKLNGYGNYDLDYSRLESDSVHYSKSRRQRVTVSGKSRSPSSYDDLHRKTRNTHRKRRRKSKSMIPHDKSNEDCSDASLTNAGSNTDLSIFKKHAPGSLGEMLMKNHMKGLIKVHTESSNTGKDKDNTTDSKENIELDQAQQTPDNNTTWDSKFTDIEALLDEDSSDEELTLRYKALQSLMLALENDPETSENVTNKREVDQILQTKSQFEEDLQKALKDSFPLDEDSLSSISSYFNNEGGTTNKQDNQDLVDMDICDSSDDGSKETLQLPINMRGILMEVEKSNIDSQPVQNTDQTNNLETDDKFQIPVKWAYMIPPPPPPDQPANDLKSLTTWCYDQNMYVQTMQETNEYNYSVPFESYSYDAEAQSCNYISNYEKGVTSEANIEPNNYYNYENTNNNDSSDLKDRHARHYKAFMNSIIEQSSAAIPSRQSNLVRIKLQNNLPTTTTTKKRKLSKRQRMRRNRELNKKKSNSIESISDLEKENFIVLDQTPDSPASSVEMSKSSKDKLFLNEDTADKAEEEDEDVLRAKLLIDMSKRRRKISESKISKLKAESLDTDKVDKTKEIISKDTSGITRNVTLYQTSNIPNRHKLSNNGGFYKDTRNVYDYKHLPDLPLFKYPPVWPVIINLDSDSSSSEDEAATVDKGPTTSIDSLIKSIRSSISSDKIDSLLQTYRKTSSNIIEPNQDSTCQKSDSPAPGGSSLQEKSYDKVANVTSPDAERDASTTPGSYDRKTDSTSSNKKLFSIIQQAKKDFVLLKEKMKLLQARKAKLRRRKVEKLQQQKLEDKKKDSIKRLEVITKSQTNNDSIEAPTPSIVCSPKVESCTEVVETGKIAEDSVDCNLNKKKESELPQNTTVPSLSNRLGHDETMLSDHSDTTSSEDSSNVNPQRVDEKPEKDALPGFCLKQENHSFADIPDNEEDEQALRMRLIRNMQRNKAEKNKKSNSESFKSAEKSVDTVDNTANSLTTAFAATSSLPSVLKTSTDPNSCKNKHLSTSLLTTTEAATRNKSVQNEERRKIFDSLEDEYLHKRQKVNKNVSDLAQLVEVTKQAVEHRDKIQDIIIKLRRQLASCTVEFKQRTSEINDKWEEISSLKNEIKDELETLKLLEAKGNTLGKMVEHKNYSIVKKHIPKSVRIDEQTQKSKLESAIKTLNFQSQISLNKMELNNINLDKEGINNISMKEIVQPADDFLCPDNGSSSSSSSDDDYSSSSNSSSSEDEEEDDEASITDLQGPQTLHNTSEESALQNRLLSASPEKELVNTGSDDSDDTDEDYRDINNYRTKKPVSCGDDNQYYTPHRKNKDDLINTQSTYLPNNSESNNYFQKPETFAQEYSPSIHPAGASEGTSKRQYSPTICDDRLQGASHKRQRKSSSIEDFGMLLCPYDLTGRCNDDHCTYDHINR